MKLTTISHECLTLKAYFCMAKDKKQSIGKNTLCNRMAQTLMICRLLQQKLLSIRLVMNWFRKEPPIPKEVSFDN
jgi:hypothetical protein